MTVHLRPYNAETDNERLAELVNVLRSHAIATAWSNENEASRPARRIQFRVTAVDTGERIVGFGTTGRDPWMTPGVFWLDLLVAPEARGQGVGMMLFDDLTQFAWELGATQLLAHVDERIPEGVRFARGRGFCLRPPGATLDLAADRARRYDEQALSALPDVPEFAGLCA
jgi:GNAT superfamily N-acetyltransferase